MNRFVYPLLALSLAIIPFNAFSQIDSAGVTPHIQKDTAVSGTLQNPIPLSAPEAEIKLFNDPGLASREYGFGILGGVVSGALGFYIGSGLESAIFGSRAKNGTLEFTGIRYDDFHGSFYGGSAGLWLGSALTAYFVGEVDEEQGSVWLTLLGGAATTAASYALASAMGVHDDIGMLPFIPLTLLPPTGAVLSYNVSRYFMDKRRIRETRQTSHLRPPSLQLGFNQNGPRMQLDALKVRF